MSSSDPAAPLALRVRGLGKCFHIYDQPHDRLKQAGLRWLGKQFFREFWALRDFSLDLRAGEAVGILGRNGSGKSTLLQMIAGTLSPTTGTIEAAGSIAALLELGSGFNPEFTGRENVYLNGSVHGLSTAQVDDRFDAVAGFADIGEFLDQPVKTYSSGMLVRLAFAVQVQLDPDVLIIDEALAVGDALFQKRCYQRLDELRSRGVSLLFVSHDQETIRTLTDRAVLLEHGITTAAGSSGEVLLAYRKLLHEEEQRWYAGHIDRATKAAAPAHITKAAPMDDRSFGDLDAVIEHVAVLNHAGDPTNLFAPGDTIRIVIVARIVRTTTHLNIAFRLRNREGVKITSWGVLNSDIRAWHAGRGGTHWERTHNAGTIVTAEFAFECRLGTNLYEVQAAVTQENDRFYRAQRVLHWRDEAAFFQVAQRVQEHNFGGVCDVAPVTTLTITSPREL